MKKIKVIHYVPGFDQGGIESRLLDWYRNIDRERIQFDLIKFTPDKDNKLLEEFKALGGKVYTLPKFTSKTVIDFRKELKKIFKINDKYDIAHCHSPTTGYFFLKEAKRFNVPVRIMHSRTTQFNSESTFIPIRNLLKKFANNYTTTYFACSRAAGLWQFGEKALLEQKVKIINNGIESEKFIFNKNIRQKVRKELNLENNFVIGHVGRFATAKNHNFLIDIFNLVYKKNNKSKLILIGDGPTKNEVRKKVEKLKLSDRVIFLGGKDNVEEYLQSMDVFLFPSIYEGFGTVVIEAQASGLQCIVSDGVPKEVAITNLVEHVSLNSSPKLWADKILKFSDGYERRNTSHEILTAGFDNKSTVNYLQKFILINSEVSVDKK